MSGELDDYGNLLSTSLQQADLTNLTNQTNADNLANANLLTNAGYGDYGFDTGYGSAGTSYLSDPNIANKLSGFAKNLYQDKNGNIDFAKVATLLGGGVAAFNANQGNKGGSGAGYQGGIPTLYAGRNMITAPPTTIGGKPRRAGGAGINYGGDVTYFNTKAEVDAQKAAADAAAAGVDTTKVDTTKKLANLGSEGYQNYINSGGTPEGYLKVINDWLRANPNVTDAQLKAKMAEFKVSPTDLQTALGAGGYSSAEQYALSHGMGSSGVNQSINNFLALFPNATKAEKQAAMDKYGITQVDVDEAIAVPAQNKAAALAAGQKSASPQDIATLFSGAVKGNTTPATVANAVASSGLSTADIVRTFNLKASDLDYLRNQNYLPAGYAEGGEIAMAKGRYLQGGTDGMADEIPAQIGKNQPAALSHGEFVVPADVVSHLGNGNSDAGAKKLYQMMDKIRMARTGNKKQGKKINPDKFMPGGLASAYAAGGEVKHFQTGGPTTSSLVNAGFTGTESNLSNWAGPYVTNMLGKGAALSEMPYQAYTGDLTAGENPLLAGAFSTAGGLKTPGSIGTAATTAGGIATKAQGLGYTPGTDTFSSTGAYTYPAMSQDGSISSTGPTGIAAQYMNPYLQASLTPQLDEARRQSQITQTQNAGKMTQAGAFGGGRQAILDAETQRALGANQAAITGSAYNTAYDKALAQFNADQARKIQEKQFGANLGLQGLQTGVQAAQAQGALGAQENQVGLANLAQQLAAGTAQRGIESEGIAADRAQFEEARANPYKMLQFQQSLLQGMPLASQAYNTGSESAIVAAAKGAKTVNELLAALGIKTPA
jgi:hypothetical protein